MTVDPILALESFGYTEREAAFLYLVAVHSGYFLRRQFDYFIDRRNGLSRPSRLWKKPAWPDTSKSLTMRQGRLFITFFHKPSTGCWETRNRKTAVARATPGTLSAHGPRLRPRKQREHYLETDADKLQFFVPARGLDSRIFYPRGEPFFHSLRQSALSPFLTGPQPSGSLALFLWMKAC